MSKYDSKFLELATSRQVVKTAIKISLLVGSILALINHGQAITQLSLTRTSFIQILLTYLVPYCVSTYSSVKALQNHTESNT